jgi:hypothetical protein
LRVVAVCRCHAAAIATEHTVESCSALVDPLRPLELVAAGDFFADPLPSADVITMGNFLHDWNLDRKMHLISSANEALPQGGALITIENLIDDARRENAVGLLVSLSMLIEFGDAFGFTGSDFAGWCREAGFREVEILPLAGPASAGIAYK